MTITVYYYPKCSTCRRALAWLDARGIAHERVDIVASPPSARLLAKARAMAGVPVKKMFNTSGESYRAGDFGVALRTMPDAEALAALAKDGKLVKRPLLVGDGVAFFGFQEDAWAEALG
jgi:arsenate reductase